MDRRLLLLSAVIIILMPVAVSAHWYYGCHADWCSYGSRDYGASNLGLWPFQQCPASMFLGADNHCHFNGTAGYGSPWYGEYYVPTSPYAASLISAPYPGNLYPPINGSCGPYGYSFDHQCVCSTGFSFQFGSCVFHGCPSGYLYDSESSRCKPDFYNMSRQVSCLSLYPCTCPSGYVPLANRACVPAN
jgi:hypothetical protein